MASQVEKLKELGVKFDTDMVIGKVLTITELMKEHGYEAVFIASGAGLPQFMHIPGEGHVGVYSANEYLTRINLMKAYDEKSSTPVLKSKSAAIVGGGNVAMDAARCAKRLGADVHIVYRRGEAELPRKKESTSTSLQAQLKSAPMKKAAFLPLSARRWNWVNRMLRGAAVLYPSRAANLNCRLIWSSWLLGRVPTP